MPCSSAGRRGRARSAPSAAAHYGTFSAVAAGPRPRRHGLHDVPCHVGADRRRHHDHHGVARHVAQAAAAQSRRPLSRDRLRAGSGRGGADVARPRPLLRRPGAHGRSRPAHLLVLRRLEDRRADSRPAVVPAPSPRFSVDGIDDRVRVRRRRLADGAAARRGDPARCHPGAHGSRARVGRAGRRFDGSRPAAIQSHGRGRPQRRRGISRRAARDGDARPVRLRRRRLALAGAGCRLVHRGRPRDRRRPRCPGGQARPLPAHAAPGGRRPRRVPGARTHRHRIWRCATEPRVRLPCGLCRRRCNASRNIRGWRDSRRPRRAGSLQEPQARRASRPTAATPAPT